MVAVVCLPLCAAAVSSIPIAPTYIILIITIAVAFPLEGVTRLRALFGLTTTRSLACTGAFGKDVLSRAKIVASPTRLAELMIFSAAIAAIPVTVRVVVLSVTVFILYERFFTYHTNLFMFRIQTLAHLTVNVIIIFAVATAVTAIPGAATVVVFVITGLIPLPSGFMTRSAAYLALVCGV